MKPVNLLPADVAVVAAAGKPNYGMIGGAAVGLLAVVGVAGYFAMARVDSVKSETTASQQRATAATTETASVQSQVQSLGQPVVDSDKQLAQGAEQVLIGAYTERHDFVALSRELRGIMQGTGGWYESVKATAGAAEGTETGVTIVGYMPTKELAASFNERASATNTLADAVTSNLKSEVLADVASRKAGRYWKFTLTATLMDTVAPYASGGGAGASSGTTVGSGAESETIELSLSPEPPKVVVKATPKAPVVPAKPKNPFDVAATAASGGTS